MAVSLPVTDTVLAGRKKIDTVLANPGFFLKFRQNRFQQFSPSLFPCIEAVWLSIYTMFSQAIDAANTKKYHLVLMDVELPEMDGFLATKILKKSQPSMPVVLLTANADPVALAAYDSSGADDIIKKPLSFQALLNVLKKIAKYVS